MNRARLIFILCFAFAVPGMAEEWPVRLGHSVEPLFQAIHLDLDPRGETYQGRTRFAIRANDRVDSIRLHAEEMRIVSARLEGVGVDQTLSVTQLTRGEIVLGLSREIEPSDYTLTIEFENDFGSRAVGLYKVEANGTSALFTQFQTIDAREAIPVWDEPSFKIPYDLTLTIPAGLDAVANAPLAEITESGETKTLRFERTPPLPSYLLAIAIGEFDFVQITGMSVPGRVVVPRGKAELGRLAAEKTPLLLEEMESYFGIRYPFEKLDLISVPDFWAGAMENAGAITFRDTILLLDTERASVGQRRWLAKVIAHELAHMWFGDLVTMEWWNDLWLNESFADWFGDRIVERVYPEFRLELSELDDVQRVMRFDARPSTGAIRREIENPEAVLDTVGLAYNKGKAILTMFERWIGEENFRKALRSHMRDQAWGSATAEEFFDALSRAAGFDIEPSMRTFLDQSGYPLITAELIDDRIVRLSQQRFSDAGMEVERQSWVVPILISYGTDAVSTTRRIVLDDDSLIVDLEFAPDWFFPDSDATGYYRWSVSDDRLPQLAARARSIMSPRQRMAFIGNVSALLSAGIIDGPTFLETMSELARDGDPVVVEGVISSLSPVLAALLTPENREPFADYIRDMLRPMIDRYGLEPRPSEADEIGELRPTLLVWLGMFGDDREIRQWARSRASRFLDDPSSMDSELRWTALRLAAIDGTRELFDRYRESFENAADPNVRRDFLMALGEFQDPKLREAALDYALEGPLRSAEILRLAFRIDQDDSARTRLWSWVQENFEAIAERIPPQSLSALVLAAGGCNVERLREAESFFTGPRMLEGMERRLRSLRDGVTECVSLRKRNLEAVNDWLAAR